MDVRDEVCEREWRELGALIGPGMLPICEDIADVKYYTSSYPGMMWHLLIASSDDF